MAQQRRAVDRAAVEASLAMDWARAFVQTLVEELAKGGSADTCVVVDLRVPKWENVLKAA